MYMLSEIVKGLYIGGLKEADNETFLVSKVKMMCNSNQGVKYVLSVTEEETPKYAHLVHKQICIPDDNINIVEHFAVAFPYRPKSHQR